MKSLKSVNSLEISEIRITRDLKIRTPVLEVVFLRGSYCSAYSLHTCLLIVHPCLSKTIAHLFINVKQALATRT